MLTVMRRQPTVAAALDPIFVTAATPLLEDAFRLAQQAGLLMKLSGSRHSRLLAREVRWLVGRVRSGWFPGGAARRLRGAGGFAIRRTRR